MSEQDNENDSKERPSWFEEWLRSIGFEEMPEWKAQYYPEWYQEMYPLAKRYGENLWWESAAIPFSFSASYAWSAISRLESAPYYQSRAEYQGAGPSFRLRAGTPEERTLYRPSYYLGEASSAYYRNQTATTPAFLAYQGSKLGSYALGAAEIEGLGLYRGFAFAPVGFAFDVATGAAEAPYISEMARQFGPEYTAAAIQKRATLYPFQAPTQAELYQSTIEWTIGQSSLLFLRPAVSSAISAIRTTGDLWAGLPALGEGIGGLSGLASGFGFGLLQLSAQLTAQELSYIYNMGAAGLGGQIYATRREQIEAAERWALITGSELAGSYLSFGLAGVGASSLMFAGAAALGMQVTSDVMTRLKAGISPTEALMYHRGSRESAFNEVWINPKLVGEKTPYTPTSRVDLQDIVGPLAWTPQYERRYESATQAFTDLTGWRWSEYPRGWAPQYERADITFSWSEVFRQEAGRTYWSQGEGFGQPLIAGTPALGKSYSDYTRAEDRFGLQEQMIRGVAEQYAPPLTSREKYELSGLAGMPSFENMSYEGYHYEVGVGYVTAGQFGSMSSFLDYAATEPGTQWYYDDFRKTWYSVADDGTVKAQPAGKSHYSDLYRKEKGFYYEHKELGPWSDTLHGYTYTSDRTSDSGGGRGGGWTDYAAAQVWKAARSYHGGSEADYYSHVMQEDWVKNWIGPLPDWLQTRLEQYHLPIPDVWAWLGREARIEKTWMWWAQGYESGETDADRTYQIKQIIYNAVYDLLNQGIIQKGYGTWTLEDSFENAQAISPGMSLKLYDDENR